ncbi:MAG: hypothetical protein ACI9S8_001024 [Chlamydiales bacterium]|jgi:hypothetical protein
MRITETPSVEITIEPEGLECPLNAWRNSRNLISEVLDNIDIFSTREAFQPQEINRTITHLGVYQKKLVHFFSSLNKLQDETRAGIEDKKICGIAKSKFQFYALSSFQGASFLAGITAPTIEGIIESNGSSNSSLFIIGYVSLISTIIFSEGKSFFQNKWEEEKNQKHLLNEIQESIFSIRLLIYKVKTIETKIVEKKDKPLELEIAVLDSKVEKSSSPLPPKSCTIIELSLENQQPSLNENRSSLENCLYLTKFPNQVELF